ncbi:nucleotidyltransferase family protein [Thermosulfurimonas dismutans]|uniref:DNA polymerase, beta-like region n=1 Tax=Thermosulfurimonas dismutans TaxID=999894 RepID=A0A179D3L1_9BACT|nr:nucleotidyltransferase domain-containing protein [Thermosulfurimonas dismutans]OAQ20647.1 DNA polymerase, beta-like region [Thermosulfurimonas dismutans]
MGSDIDILVEFERLIGLKIVGLKDYLERILGVKVDVVSKKAVIRKPRLSAFTSYLTLACQENLS